MEPARVNECMVMKIDPLPGCVCDRERQTDREREGEKERERKRGRERGRERGGEREGKRGDSS